jgi:L-rhamnose mutarotase
VAAMQAEPVNARWQELMGPYFVAGDAPADQQMRALDEVFHLP